MKQVILKTKKTGIYIGLILLSIICIIPMYIMVVNSTRSGYQIVQGLSWIPGTSIMDNYSTMSDFFNVWRGFFNSLFIAVTSTFLTSYVSALTAYGFSIYDFKFKNAIFNVILVMMMVPTQLSLIGFYEFMSKVGLLNSYIPLILPTIASPFTVFFLRQYIKSTLPYSIIEAARIDGVSEISIFHRIAFPIMRPGVATMAIFAFIASWNNYILPLVLITDVDKYTLPVLMGFMGASVDLAKNMGATYLGISISIVPIMIAYLFFSKYIISSVSAGSVKG